MDDRAYPVTVVVGVGLVLGTTLVRVNKAPFFTGPGMKSEVRFPRTSETKEPKSKGDVIQDNLLGLA